MKQKRLEAICSYLTNQDKIIDVGCDHAYVCIEMSKRGAKKIIASDIHPNALKMARENIKKSGQKIELICSDGLKEINTTNYDTLILAGMGANTILHILDNPEKRHPIQKIIIQSNNHLKEIRKRVNQFGYILKEETIVFEKSHYYTIMKWEKGTQKLTKLEQNLGLWNQANASYYQDLWDKLESIRKKIPKRKWIQKYKLKKEQKELQKYLKKTN